jgi:NAD(P)H-hydrate repair Nnr-like enzyme with NAD(P)H-hydrate dehydratase domain
MAGGADPFTAACEAVWLHGQSARICGAAFTPLDLARGVSAAMARGK